MQERPKLCPLRDSGVVIIILSKHEKTPFWKKSPFNVLDDQVDTLSFILSPKFVNFFLAIMIHLVEMYLFCDKTFVVRPTSDPKKLKFMKIPLKLVGLPEMAPGGYLGDFWPIFEEF